MIQSIATSPNCAILISLAFNVALAWGWWRREIAHTQKYDVLRAEWLEREASFYEILAAHDGEISAISREAFGAMSDTASALSGMEGSLDRIEMILRTYGTPPRHNNEGRNE